MTAANGLPGGLLDTGDDPIPRRPRLPLWLKATVALAAILAAASCLLSAVLFTRVDEQVDRNARSSVALCALREDLQLRVDGAEKFLAEHPDGLPGIPAKTIRDGAENQQRTISTLHVLKCPKPRP